jgi:hypothetical protein
MIKSPAWSVLSLSARRVLDRIEIEHADHGGNDNGRLPVTYDDFERYGIHRHAIRAAIQETVALGFVEITERGRAGNREFRSPHKFRLTYFPVGRPHRQTKGSASRRAKRPKHSPGLLAKRSRKKQNSSGGKRQILVAETDTENAKSIVRKPLLLGSVRIPPLLLYLGEGRHRRPTGGALPLQRCRNIFPGWRRSWRGAWRRKSASTHVG